MSATLHATPRSRTDAAAVTAGTARSSDKSSGESSGKGRDPWFDNAKMLLVTLVVVGHTWELLPRAGMSGALYDFLYLWHVPAFVMVTGYLSRSFTWSRRNLRRLLTGVALPYVVFEAALAGFRTYVGGEELNTLFADPHWPLWYLAALFVWRLLTPALDRVPAALPLSVVACLLGGLATVEVLDTSRVLGLLPFFVAGLLARPEHIELLRRPASRLAAVGALTVALGTSLMLDGAIPAEWLYWRSGYAELDVSFAEGALVRLALLVASGLLALSFLTLVPQRAGRFAQLGAATLVVYLFHGFAVKSADYAGFSGWAAAHVGPALLVTSALAVVLAVGLAWPPVAKRLSVVVDPVTAYRRR